MSSYAAGRLSELVAVAGGVRIQAIHDPKGNAYKSGLLESNCVNKGVTHKKNQSAPVAKS